MPFQECKPTKIYKRARIAYQSLGQGVLYVPVNQRKYLTEAFIKILFDPESSLIALKPSKDRTDYPRGSPYIYMTSFLRTYKIPEQIFDLEWEKERGWLIGRIKR